jgi:hypothetical protein
VRHRAGDLNADMIFKIDSAATFRVVVFFGATLELSNVARLDSKNDFACPDTPP